MVSARSADLTPEPSEWSTSRTAPPAGLRELGQAPFQNLTAGGGAGGGGDRGGALSPSRALAATEGPAILGSGPAGGHTRRKGGTTCRTTPARTSRHSPPNSPGAT